MSLIVKTVSRLTVGLILLYGIYITSHGHLSPGGGFAGGVIIALSFVHLLLAYGKTAALRKLPKGAAANSESLGALLFLALGLLGFAGGYFLLNFLPRGEPFRLFSAGIILPANLAIGLKVGAGLFALVLALVLFRADNDD
jgi:multicomponent Na+:H+ antiporter subunit B